MYCAICCVLFVGKERVLFVYLCVGTSPCVFYVALVLLLWISVRKMWSGGAMC